MGVKDQVLADVPEVVQRGPIAPAPDMSFKEEYQPEKYYPCQHDYECDSCDHPYVYDSYKCDHDYDCGYHGCGDKYSCDHDYDCGYHGCGDKKVCGYQAVKQEYPKKKSYKKKSYKKRSYKKSYGY